MVFDECGLPKDLGATDYMDSARLAGLLALLEHPDMTREKIALYYDKDVRKPLRYPFKDYANPASNNPRNFTRDQLLCLSAGMSKLSLPVICYQLYLNAKANWYRAENTEYDVVGSAKKFPNGADWLTPSHMNHLRMCAGLQPTLLGKAWLAMDILYNAYISPMGEPNQLLAMCVVAGPKWVRMLRRLNKKLDAAIMAYWGGWRLEEGLANYIINKTKEY